MLLSFRYAQVKSQMKAPHMLISAPQSTFVYVGNHGNTRSLGSHSTVPPSQMITNHNAIVFQVSTGKPHRWKHHNVLLSAPLSTSVYVGFRGNTMPVGDHHTEHHSEVIPPHKAIVTQVCTGVLHSLPPNICSFLLHWAHFSHVRFHDNTHTYVTQNLKQHSRLFIAYDGKISFHSDDY